MNTIIFLESFRAIILLAIVLYLWQAGRGRFNLRREGWQYIIAGFSLLLFGSIIDITDEFPSLSQYVVIGATPIQAILEKMIGFLGGFLLLAMGLVRWIPFVQDLSDEVAKQTKDLRQAKEHADIANKTKSQFLANISHELRTPLNSIIGFSDMIRRAGHYNLENQSLAEYGEHIHSSSEHLLRIINDILDLSKIEAGEMRLNESEFVLQRMIKNAINIVSLQAEQKQLTISFENDGDESDLLGDEQKLRQIMLNILSNAIKFTPEQGQITISIAKQGTDMLHIKTKDTGIGMTEEQIKEAMMTFRQIENSLSRNFEGTGLGLPLTKALTEMHQGHLLLNSKVDEGTEVIVELPASRIIS